MAAPWARFDWIGSIDLTWSPRWCNTAGLIGEKPSMARNLRLEKYYRIHHVSKHRFQAPTLLDDLVLGSLFLASRSFCNFENFIAATTDTMQPVWALFSFLGHSMTLITALTRDDTVKSSWLAYEFVIGIDCSTSRSYSFELLNTSCRCHCFADWRAVPSVERFFHQIIINSARVKLVLSPLWWSALRMITKEVNITINGRSESSSHTLDK